MWNWRQLINYSFLVVGLFNKSLRFASNFIIFLLFSSYFFCSDVWALYLWKVLTFSTSLVKVITDPCIFHLLNVVQLFNKLYDFQLWNILWFTYLPRLIFLNRWLILSTDFSFLTWSSFSSFVRGWRYLNETFLCFL